MPLIRVHAVRAALACGSVAASLAAGAPAHADDTEACVSAYEKAQELRLDHKLRAARAQLEICSRTVCPGAARQDCDRWAREVDARTPSVVVTGRRGTTPVTDGRVFADGVDVASALGPTPIMLDPGDHVVRVEPGRGDPREVRVLLREGDGPHQIDFEWAAEPTTPQPVEPDTRSPGIPVASYVSAGIGVVGLASLTFFGLEGRSDSLHLHDTCFPNCPDAQVSSAQRELLAADVSLGVAVIAFATAAYFYLTRGAPPATPQAGVSVLPTGALRLTF